MSQLRWVLSRRDCQVHLLVPASDHPWGVRKARCGHLLPSVTRQYERPPWGSLRVFPTCAVIAHRPPSVPDQRWVSHLTTPAVPTGQRGKVVGAIWGRCPVDGLLHLLSARALLGIRAQGCAVAYCGALLVTENLVLRGSGTPCPTCLVGSTS